MPRAAFFKGVGWFFGGGGFFVRYVSLKQYIHFLSGSNDQKFAQSAKCAPSIQIFNEVRREKNVRNKKTLIINQKTNSFF